jgi:genome maintenance exonuclease 1
MNFTYEKISQLDFDLESETTENGRIYITPEGNRYPSITTVLSATDSKEGLIAWRERVGEEEANKIMGRSARRGTELHSICEKYLLNEMSPIKLRMMMPHVKELFYKIKPFIDENVTKVHGLEQALYSDKLKIAGRTDCICEWNGVLSVLDFKNSIKIKREEYIQDYFLQCTAYSLMFEELVSIAVEQIVILVGVEQGNGQIFIKRKDDYVENLISRINTVVLSRERRYDDINRWI